MNQQTPSLPDSDPPTYTTLKKQRPIKHLVDHRRFCLVKLRRRCTNLLSMKLLTNIALILLAVITSFLVGRWSAASPDGPAELPHAVSRAAGAQEASIPPYAPPKAAVKP